MLDLTHPLAYSLLNPAHIAPAIRETSMNTKTKTATTPTTTLGQQLTNNAVHLEGNKGFNFAKPATGIAGKIDFSIALSLPSIPASIPRQVQLVMTEWLAQGKGSIDIQAINDSLETKGLWKRANGAAYNQDVSTILLHYRAMLLGTATWGKNGAKLQLATFGS